MIKSTKSVYINHTMATYGRHDKLGSWYTYHNLLIVIIFNRLQVIEKNYEKMFC